MSKPNKDNLILWGFGLVAMALVAKPAIAQETTVEVASLPKSASVSTQARDLLLPGIELQEYFIDINTRTYELGQLNLEQFCQDFPYNSKCQGTTTPSTPARETDTNPIPVPVPPPAPSKEQESSRTSQKSGWAIVPEISTLGLGGHVVRKVIPQINARVGINAFSLGLDGIDTDIDYEADLNLFSVSTLADFHPFKSSGFRISGGLIFANNNFDGSANVSDLVIDELEAQGELDEEIIAELETINELATVDAEVEITNGVSPYLGIGGGNAVAKGKGLGFWWNLGVVFSGSPDIDINTDVADNQIREQLDEESTAEVDRVLEETQEALDEVVDDEEDDIQDTLDFVNIYPVVSLGISYQF